MNLFTYVLLISMNALAGQKLQYMNCQGANLNGIKAPVQVQVAVLNSMQLVGMKIKFKNQVWVNELDQLQGQPYNEGLIRDHFIFKAKTDKDLAIILPANFRILKKMDAYLAHQNGDEINFTALACVLHQ